MSFKIFAGSQYRDLATRIATDLNCTLGDLKIEKFLDGEILPTFKESIRDTDVFFVNSTSTSDLIMETLLVLDAAKRAGCKSFNLVAPYQGYSRQDKTDHLRSSIGSKLLADILVKAGMTSIITIDLHNSAIQAFYDVPVIHLNGNKITIDYIHKLQLEEICFVAPDQGAVKRASDFCKGFPEATFAMINKKRIKPNEIHSMELVGEVEGKNVIIVDDLIDTGNTLAKAADLIISKGAKSVRAIATHGVLSGRGPEIIDGSKICELVVTDSIVQTVATAQKSNKIKVVSCDKLISRAIWSLTQNVSIHELNKIRP